MMLPALSKVQEEPFDSPALFAVLKISLEESVLLAVPELYHLPSLTLNHSKLDHQHASNNNTTARARGAHVPLRPNAQVRQVALSSIVGFSAKDSPQRSLLISKHKNRDGSPLLGRDGKEVDTVEDLKRLCQDQPITAHDAFSALINISDSLVLARKIGDKAFLEFLVRYIADPVSLLADLACMLLSNLTKLESICAILLDLQVQARPFYSFMASEEMEGALNGMDVEPNDPEYAAKKAKADEYARKVAEQAKKMDEKVPAMARLLDAFEEGATVASQGSDLEAMKQRAKDAATKAESDKEPEKVERGPDGRPRIKRKTNCNFLASVFANATVLPRGRDWFVTPLSASSSATSAIAQAALARGVDKQGAIPAATEYPVARTMAFTEHPNLIRRGGVISTLKNVLFVKSAHKLLVAPPHRAKAKTRCSQALCVLQLARLPRSISCRTSCCRSAMERSSPRWISKTRMNCRRSVRCCQRTRSERGIQRYD